MFPQKKIGDSFIDEPESLKILVMKFRKISRLLKEMDEEIETKRKK
jgi:hypothetical protein